MITMLIFLAPARLNAWIIAFELVPLTRLSSITTTCFPAMISLIGIIHRLISILSLWCGSIKLRNGPFLLYLSLSNPSSKVIPNSCAYPKGAGLAESGTGITRSASLIGNFFAKNRPMFFLEM